MKNFNEWYTRINEEIAEPTAEPVVADSAEASTETSRDAIMHDVDTIMTSLETLAAELKEELETESIDHLNEASGDKASLVMQWAWHGPRMVKKQAKINNMKLKESDMEIAAAKLQNSDDSDKKKYLVDKGRQLTQNIKEIQAQVNDMAADYGSYVEKVVKRKRLEGDLAVVKAQIGNIGDSKEMKDRMKDIVSKMKEEDIAIQDMTARAEDDAQDLKGDDKIQLLKKQKEMLKERKSEIDKMSDGPEKEAALAQYGLKLAQIELDIAIEDPNQSKSIDSAKEKLKKAEDRLEKVKAKAATNNTEETPGTNNTEKTPGTNNTEETPGTNNTEKTPASNNTGVVGQSDGADDETKKQREVKNAKDGKLDRVQQMIDAEEEKLVDPKDKAKIKEYEDGIKQLEDKEKKSKQDQNNLDMLKVALKNLQDKVAKSGSSPKLDKLKKLKADIMAKENWQLEGTELGRIFEMEISKLEMEYLLNESLTLNIKDRFSRLI
jgi:hypothetical protein